MGPGGPEVYMTVNVHSSRRHEAKRIWFAFALALLVGAVCFVSQPAFAVDATSDNSELSAGSVSSAEESLAAAAEVGSAKSTVRRLSGATRYDTMSSIVSAGFSESSTVVVASGDNFPDSLSAAALAGSLNAPVLLTSGGELSSQTSAQVKALGATKAFVLGGTAAVSDNVVSELGNLGLVVKRIAGATRQETAVAVARQVASTSPVKTVVVASGNAPWDSLSISPYCYANAIPVILAQGDGRLSSDELALLKSLGVKNVVITGGSAAVSSSVESQLSGYKVERWWGATRYETSRVIAQRVAAKNGASFYIALTSGENYPDALSSSSFLGLNSGVLLLTSGSDQMAFGVLSSYKQRSVSCYVLGGIAALPPSVENRARESLGIAKGNGEVDPIGKTVLAFVPHQDDELLTMGAAISQYVAAGYDVHVILCTDGSSSYVRDSLGNGKTCDLHSGKHSYELSRSEFSAARDREFMDSCKALGVTAGNIHIEPSRAIDGSLSRGTAQSIVSTYLQRYPGAEVWATSPLAGDEQNVDHRTLGSAIEQMCLEGTISDHKYFVEPYLISNFVKENSDIDLSKLSASDEDLRMEITDATQAYCLWKPEQGRYAIGCHSVLGDFGVLLNDPPASWWYE